jgi:hypothetical protein
MAPKSRLPRLAIVLGVLGLIPFLISGFGAVGLDPVQLLRLLGSKLIPSLGVEVLGINLDPAAALRMLAALMAYSAVILSFLGAVHWGIALTMTEATSRAVNDRLILGVIPALVGWGGLLLVTVLPPEAGLGVLSAGFIGTMLVEARAGRESVPAGYLWLRWILSVVVVAVLLTVLVLRLLDAHARAAG